MNILVCWFDVLWGHKIAPVESMDYNIVIPHSTISQRNSTDLFEYGLETCPDQLGLPLLSSSVLIEGDRSNHELLRRFTITRGQRNLVHTDDAELSPPAPSDDEQGTSLFTQMLNCIGEEEARNILLTKDRSGQFLLHNACTYGLSGICQVIMKRLRDFCDLVSLKKVVLSPDNQSLTALHHAVIAHNIASVRCILHAFYDTSGTVQDEDICFTLGDTLIIALKYQNDAVISALFDSGASVNWRTTSGETALHIAAQLGQLDYVKRLTQVMSGQNAELDALEHTRGWTPLFNACAGGFSEIVKLLLECGVSQTVRDSLGWTAQEHAAFRGHLSIAELF